jgi:hypothetical protein
LRQDDRWVKSHVTRKLNLSKFTVERGDPTILRESKKLVGRNKSAKKALPMVKEQDGRFNVRS